MGKAKIKYNQSAPPAQPFIGRANAFEENDLLIDINHDVLAIRTRHHVIRLGSRLSTLPHEVYAVPLADSLDVFKLAPEGSSLTISN